MSVIFVCSQGRIIPNYGEIVAGRDYEMNRALAEELARQGAGHIVPPKKAKAPTSEET